MLDCLLRILQQLLCHQLWHLVLHGVLELHRAELGALPVVQPLQRSVVPRRRLRLRGLP